MNREIKFRFWGKHSCEYISNKGTIKHNLKTIQSIANVEDFIPEQYTGLKDKNGVEVCEGDIVSFEGLEPMPVINKLGAFGYDPCFHSDLRGEEFISFAQNHNFHWKDNQTDRLEVTGNIHENPGLLETEE